MEKMQHFLSSFPGSLLQKPAPTPYGKKVDSVAKRVLRKQNKKTAKLNTHNDNDNKTNRTVNSMNTKVGCVVGERTYHTSLLYWSACSLDTPMFTSARVLRTVEGTEYCRRNMSWYICGERKKRNAAGAMERGGGWRLKKLTVTREERKRGRRGKKIRREQCTVRL